MQIQSNGASRPPATAPLNAPAVLQDAAAEVAKDVTKGVEAIAKFTGDLFGGDHATGTAKSRLALPFGIPNPFGAAKDACESVADGVKDTVDHVADAVSDGADKVKHGIGGLLHSVAEAVTGDDEGTLSANGTSLNTTVTVSGGSPSRRGPAPSTSYTST
jgi:hypothetical protein